MIGNDFGMDFFTDLPDFRTDRHDPVLRSAGGEDLTRRVSVPEVWWSCRHAAEPTRPPLALADSLLDSSGSSSATGEQSSLPFPRILCHDCCGTIPPAGKRWSGIDSQSTLRHLLPELPDSTRCAGPVGDCLGVSISKFAPRQ